MALLIKEEEIKKAPSTKPAVFVDETQYTDVRNEKLGDDPESIADQVELMERADLHLFGVMQTRILGVLSLRQEIIGEGEPAVFVKSALGHVKEFKTTFLYQLLHSSITSGFAVAEKVSIEHEGKWLYDKLLTHGIQYFDFGKKNELRRVDKDDPVAVNEVSQFSVMTFRKLNNNRYGTPLYDKVYWYWYLKKEAAKFWALYTERNVAPLIVGKYNRDSGSKEIKADVKSFLTNIRNQTKGIFPEGITFDILKTMNTGGAVSYEKFLKYLDDKISIAILGQTLTTSHGQAGSYALGKVHEQVKFDILNADILMLEEFVNENIIRPLCNCNFSNLDEYPKWTIVESKQENKKEMAEIIEIIAGRLKYKGIPVSYLHEVLGIPNIKEGSKDVPLIVESTPEPAKQFGDFHKETEMAYYLNEIKKIK